MIYLSMYISHILFNLTEIATMPTMPTTTQDNKVIVKQVYKNDNDIFTFTAIGLTILIKSVTKEALQGFKLDCVYYYQLTSKFVLYFDYAMSDKQFDVISALIENAARKMMFPNEPIAPMPTNETMPTNAHTPNEPMPTNAHTPNEPMPTILEPVCGDHTMQAFTKHGLDMVLAIVGKEALHGFNISCINYYTDFDDIDVIFDYSIPHDCGYDNILPMVENAARKVIGIE